jgi:hypothetical protein
LQSGPYKAHLEWLKDDPNQKGETIRFAMVSARSRGEVKLDDWSASLTDTRKTLRRSRGSSRKKPDDENGLFDE